MPINNNLTKEAFTYVVIQNRTDTTITRHILVKDMIKQHLNFIFRARDPSQQVGRVFTCIWGVCYIEVASGTGCKNRNMVHGLLNLSVFAMIQYQFGAW